MRALHSNFRMSFVKLPLLILFSLQLCIQTIALDADQIVLGGLAAIGQSVRDGCVCDMLIYQQQLFDTHLG